MTSPSPFGPSDDSNIARANWLGRYLDVENDGIKRLSEVLSDAADAIDESFKRIFKPANFSEQVRKSQLALVSSAVRSKVKEVFGDSTDIIKNSQQDAAVAAVNASLYDDRSILSQMFGNQTDRTQYADSLRATARRNIDAVMTRVLETEQPFSRRVYHSQAIATGLVNQIVNRSLAKGDSAADLAKAVKDSIRPDVPGGVSYAAKRLARTEINNAFHAQSIHDMQQFPWVDSVEWNLSKTHAETGCLCEQYARIKTFPKENVPAKPHPNCRCFVVAKNMDYDSFENSLVAGQFDSYLDSVIPKPQGEIGSSYSTGLPDSFTKSGDEIPLPPEPPVGTGKPRPTAQLKRNAAAAQRVSEAAPNARITGFDDVGLDPKAAASYAKTMARLAKEHPDLAASIDSIGFEDMEPGIYGVTSRGEVNRRTGGRRSRRMALNTHYVQDLTHESNGLQTRANRDVANGFHTPVASKDAVAQTVSHEFAHVGMYMLENTPSEITRDDAFNYLGQKYQEIGEPYGKGAQNWARWVEDHLAGYSFEMDRNGDAVKDFLGTRTGSTTFRFDEAIPEAFSAVFLGQANDAEKALYELLIDSLQTRLGNVQ